MKVRSIWSLRLALAVSLACGNAVPLRAWQEPAGAAADNLRYRRVYAPADELENLASGFLPLKQADFDRLIRLGQASATPPAVHVRQASYRARLGEGPVLEGTAVLDIEHRGDQAHSLALDGCRLALRRPTWLGEQPAPATLGGTRDGRHVVMVERSGMLGLNWSLQGDRPHPRGTISFRVQVPPCPINELRLALPPSLTPDVDGALVAPDLEVLDDELDPSAVEDEGRVAVGAGASWRHWQIIPGGRTDFELRLIPDDAAAGAERQVLVGQTTSYEFSPEGVDVAAELRLDVAQGPLARLEVRLERPLELTAVRQGDQPLPWTAASPAAGEPTRVTIRPAAPLEGRSRIVLSAFAPLRETSTGRLPGLIVPGSVWQGGQVRLAVAEPLALLGLGLDGCHQRDLQALESPRAGEVRTIELEHSAAAIEVSVGFPRPRLSVAGGTTLRLTPSAVLGQQIVDVQSRQGEHFAISANVDAAWIIDAVKSVPDDALEDWDVVARGRGRQRLELLLRQPLVPAESLRLIIHGRRRGIAVGEAAAAADLQMLSLRGAVAESSFFSVATDAPLVLRAIGDAGVTWLRTSDLTEQEAQRVNVGNGDLLFRAGEDGNSLRFLLGRGSPRFTADVQVDLLVGPRQITERYRLRCMPDANPLSAVQVFLGQARDVPVRWFLAGDWPRPLPSRRLGPGEQPDWPADRPGETWVVQLPKPASDPLELVGERSSNWTDSAAPALASLPDASSQRATLAVHAIDGAVVHVDTRALKSLPAESSAPGRASSLIGMYRYTPSRDFVAGTDFPVTISTAPPEDRQPGAWAWLCVLDSAYAEAGANRHRAVFFLQNSRAQRVRWRLEEGMIPRRLVLDQVEQPLAPADESGWRTIALAEDVRLPALSVEFEGPRLALRDGRWLAPPQVELDVPVASRRWTAWLPPTVAAVDHQQLDLLLTRDPPTLSERLLGPLARSKMGGVRGHPFRLLAAEDWRELFGAGQQADAQLQAGREWIEWFGDDDAARAGSDPATWGEVLGSYPGTAGTAAGRVAPSLLVDADALEEQGIGPASPLPSGEGATRYQRGRGVLEQSGVTVLATPTALVLTSHAERARCADLVQGGGDPALGWTAARITPGSIRADARATEPRGTARVLTVADWLSDRQTPTPRAALGGTSETDLARMGWRAYRLELPGTGSVRLRVYRPAIVGMLGWGMLLGALSASLLLPLRRAPAWLGLLGIFAAAAIWVPPYLLPIATGAWLGLLSGGLIRLAGLRDMLRVPAWSARSAWPSLRTASVAGSIALVIALVTAWVDSAAESPPAAANAASTHSLPTVVIPVDAQGAPEGEYLFVPRPFYEALHRRANAGSNGGQAWLLASATYRTNLVWEAAQAQLVATRLVATYDLHVFQKDAAVQVPLSRSGVNLLDEDTRLDGRPVPVDWLPDGSALTIQVAHPGRYRLELALVPTIRQADGQRGFDLRIPSLLRSRLDVVLPAAAPMIQLQSPLGATEQDAARGRLTAQLGPIDRLSVRWPTAENAAEQEVRLEVEQLLWVRIRPGSVLLDARLHCTVPGGSVSRVRLEADAGLEPITPADNGARATVQPVPGDARQFVILPLSPLTERGTIDLSFLVSGAPGIGTVRLPQLQLPDAQVTRRWLAVSIDPALEYEPTLGVEAEAVSTAEFARRWGAAEAAPQMALELSAADAARIATRIARPRSSATVTASMCAERQRLEMVVEADIQTVRGRLFQQRLSLPPGLRVQEVGLTRQGIAQPLRWFQNAAGEVTVFPESAQEGQFRLTWRGWLRVPSSGQVPLDAVTLADCESVAYRYRLLRRPSTSVAWAAAKNSGAGAQSLIAGALVPAPAGESGFVRELAQWEQLEDAPAAAVVVRANKPLIVGDQITSVRRDKDGWKAELDCRLRVEGGLADCLRFDVPDNWGEGLVLEPAEVHEFRVLPYQGMRRLHVWPKQPVQGDYRLRMQARLDVSVSNRVTAPDIVPLDMALAQRLVLVPTRIEDQQITWETRGLRAVPFPEGREGADVSPETFAAYQVFSPRFEAGLKSVQPVSGVPEVRLADCRIAWDASGSYHAAAAFDLEPAGLQRCRLQLPERSQLVQVLLDGTPCMVRRRVPREWQMALGPDQLPQRIEVVWLGTAEAPDGSRSEIRLASPTLLGPTGEKLHVRKTLWSVVGPPRAGPAIPLAGGQPAGTRQLESYRLQSAAGLVASAVDFMAENTAQEVARWYAPWARRIRDSGRTIAEVPPADGEADPRDPLELRTIYEQQTALAERLGTSSLRDALARSREVSREVADLWQHLAARRAPAIQLVGVDPADSVLLRYARPEHDARGTQVAASILLGLAGILGFYAVRVTWNVPWLDACPQLVGVGVGLAWWLWLEPSLFGWLIVAVSVLSAVWSPWPRRPLRRTA